MGYAGVYHEADVDGWDGPTAFYLADLRAPLAWDESMTWSRLYLWADVEYGGEEMPFAMEVDEFYPPPADREYLLELVAVPDQVVGAPEVGTVWTLSLDELFFILLPVHLAYDGLTGYEFAFTITASTNPCGPAVRGDADCDGDLDFDDIDLFVAALGGEEAWAAIWDGDPPCDYLCVNDVDGSGGVDFDDIDAFVACLSGACP